MADEPVEIDLRLNQNVDSEGKKAVESINDISEASEKMKAEMQAAIDAQKVTISQLKAEIVGLKKELAKPVTTNDSALIAEKEKLTQTITQLEKKLKDAEAAYLALAAKQKQTSAGASGIGQTAVTASKGVNQLSYSVQQVARELPSLTISPQMFFLAISNNLPILQDQLRKTRIENEALKASGQSTVPVWKQVAKSIFSWQTALVAGITILTVYGKDIFAAARNLFDFGESARLTRQEIKELNTALTENLGSELGKMNQLFDRLKAAEKGTNDYYSAKRDLIKQYGSYLSGLDSEIVALNDIEGAYRAVSDAIVEQARQKALSNVYEEQGQKLLDETNKKYALIKESLVDLFGEDIGNFKFQQFRKEFESGKGLSVEMQRIIDSFQNSMTQTIGSSVTGAVQTVTFDTNPVQNAIDEIVKAQDAAKTKIQEASSIMGDSFGGVTKKVSSLIQAQKDLIEEYKLLPEETEAQVSAKNKLIEAAEKEIKRLNELGKTNERFLKKQETDQEKASETLAKTTVDFQQEIDAATIAAMQDGAAKKLAQVEAEYQKRKDTIAQKLAEIEKLEKTTGVTATGQRNLLASLLEASTAQYQAEKAGIESAAKTEIDSVFADVNERFTSQLDNQLNKVNEYYAKQLAIISENVTSEIQLKKLSADLEETRLRELSIIRQEYNLKQLDFESQIALKRQELANKELLWEADKQRKLLEIQLDAATKRLRILNDLTVSGADVSEEVNQTRHLIEVLSGEIDATGKQKFAEIADAISQVGQSVADFISIFDEDAGTLAGWASQATAIAGNLASGNYIQAGQQALQLVGQIIKANREANKEIQEFNYNISQQAIQYSLAVIEAIKDIDSSSDSIFSTDYGNVLTQSMLSYNKAIAQQGDLMNQLGDATIKTGVQKRKFLGITFGTKDIYESLLKTYPDLIDADGNLNKELAQTLINTGNLSKESQDLVQNILDAANAADEAMNQFESTLSSLIGQLGDDLKTVLDDAFSSGTDAAAKMFDAIGNYIQKLATQMLFSATFGDILSDLEARMKASYSDNGDQSITDDLIWFTENYGDATNSYLTGLESLRKWFESNGLDWTGTDRTASTKGIAQASQDSVDELNGRITNIQQLIYDIRANGQQNIAFNTEFSNHQKMVRSKLDTLVENSDFLKRLKRIDESLNTMNLNGIKLK